MNWPEAFVISSMVCGGVAIIAMVLLIVGVGYNAKNAKHDEQD